MMTVVMSRWEEFELALREQAYGTIDADPRLLLETDGGPVGMKADVIFARLIGMDDNIVQDGWRLPRVEPYLLMPIPLSRRERMANYEPTVADAVLRTAKFVLQSGFAHTRVSGEYAPPGVSLDSDFMFDVLYLRYKRRAL